ncbi:hypothetical protein GLOTRDRAFT_140907 [Gloeophyllum trabeum ATCC 11539]|uniref:Uncharacterized protein n=1 Tax=Gloeophyllum trabeum (strain ATCC 11539 / FP-39264 / Madison 617) TaxID=670483 RepID=S7RB47_GLOTA|nr:uncharacterized protein GLOTRDRAFT_140907 [Gloeophyllum trabeum ATCC 11539]EPQ51455.1 hypothetical protein GLOTRDRAFT_140907 [Gloeophyllum trabeum ATCC 11539]
MRSFTAIFTVAAAAFAGFASAAPVDTSAVSGALDTVKGVVSGVPVVGGIVPRTDAPRGVQEILIEVQTKITPLVQQIQFIKADNATVDALTPVVQGIEGILKGVVPELQTLVGQPVEVILASVTGTAQVTVGEVAQLVANILTLVFGALNSLLNVVGTGLAALQPLLNALGAAVAALLTAVLAAVNSVVGGLLSAVLGLIGDIVPIILNLNLATVISILKL